MRVLTVWQPAASALATGLIQYELRSKPMSYRGPLAIHAGKRSLSEAAYKEIASQLKPVELPLLTHYGLLPFGSIIAICDLVDCVELTEEFMDTVDDIHFVFGEWLAGRYALKFANMQKLKNPITAKGRQGLWTYNGRRNVRVIPTTGQDSSRLDPTNRHFYNEQRVIG